MIDHPDKFSKKFIAKMFNQSESKLNDFSINLLVQAKLAIVIE